MLPHWARKPKHKSEVVATSKGWEVKETGELLKSVKDLDYKLSKLGQRTPVGVVAAESEAAYTPPVQEPQTELENELDALEDEEAQEPSVSDSKEEAAPTQAEESSDAEKEEQSDTDAKPKQETQKKRRGRPRKK